MSPIDNRLEIFHDNVYGTVCDDEWSFSSSVVACRQMNFDFVNTTYTTTTPIKDELQTIWLDSYYVSFYMVRLKMYILPFFIACIFVLDFNVIL